ncbi:MAG: hypothetical protein CVV48_09325 [Spirochaetae bacterium HGW-Spirochaetae-4]|nr:MAG: hypothetical protein CVV48_09325 [Spirochaetae bacterium HGW-Spirochaetae-4]
MIMEKSNHSKLGSKLVLLAVFLVVSLTMVSLSSCFLLISDAEVWVDNWTNYDYYIYADSSYLGYVAAWGDETFTITLESSSEYVTLEARYADTGNYATSTTGTLEAGSSYTWTID